MLSAPTMTAQRQQWNWSWSKPLFRRAIAVIALGAILAIAATRRTPAAPVAIAAVPAPGAQSTQCQALLNTLPDSLGGLERAATAQPTPVGTAAWRGS